MHQEYKDRLTVVAINIQENRGTVAAWVKDKRVSFMVLLDPDGAVTQRYDVTATPTVFVLGKHGKLVGKALGTKSWTSDPGHALLTRLVGP